MIIVIDDERTFALSPLYKNVQRIPLPDLV